LTADKPFDYVVQIVTDRPEFGGLSGATINEAKTWKKVNQQARISTVNCDISIALPLIISAIMS
jgi:deoxyhypusine synthase